MTVSPTSPFESSPAETAVTRIASGVVGLLLGALFGVMGTVVNQSQWDVPGLVTIPIGLVVSLPAVALLLIGLRMVLRSRVVAILAAFGVVVAIFLLSQPSAGGSVLVPANALGIVWTFAPTLIALVVLAWPRLRTN